MHYIKSNNNKPLSISGPISTPGVAINHVGSLLIDPNSTNTSASSEENAITIDSVIKNERTEELNRDTKVGLKVQLNTATMALVFHRLITVTEIRWCPPLLSLSLFTINLPLFVVADLRFPESNFYLVCLMQSL